MQAKSVFYSCLSSIKCEELTRERESETKELKKIFINNNNNNKKNLLRAKPMCSREKKYTNSVLHTNKKKKKRVTNTNSYFTLASSYQLSTRKKNEWARGRRKGQYLVFSRHTIFSLLWTFPCFAQMPCEVRSTKYMGSYIHIKNGGTGLVDLAWESATPRGAIGVKKCRFSPFFIHYGKQENLLAYTEESCNYTCESRVDEGRSLALIGVMGCVANGYKMWCHIWSCL
jgi:hypothetical protein